MAAGRSTVAHTVSNVKTLEFVVGALHIALFASLKRHAEFCYIFKLRFEPI
jgi:hypothetical protein